MEVKDKKPLNLETSKSVSSLTKDINRIRKCSKKQMKMNTLRKYQIRLYQKFLEKLLEEKRITKEEWKEYTPKKKDIEKKLFKI